MDPAKLIPVVAVAAMLSAGNVTFRAAPPVEGGGAASLGDPCSADIDESGGVDFADLLILLSQWGPCPPCDSSGVWTNSQAPVYACAFGFVDFNIQSWTFVLEPDALTVLGAPGPMTGPPVACHAGNQFTVSGTLPGTCDEIYTLTGTFTDESHFEGTFTAQFVGDCFDCVNQAWDVSATRE